MRKRKFLIINIIRVIFLILIYTSYQNFHVYDKVIKANNSIKYEIINTEKHSGGRGSYFSISVKYLDKEYNLNITSNTYKSILSKKFPALYYVENKDKVISDWQRTVSKRLFILFIICFSSSLIPISKISALLENRIKTKN